MLYVLAFILILLTIFYFYSKNGDNYWKKRGVATPPTSIIFGNLKDVILMKKSMGELYAEIYQNFPNLPVVGIYKTAPALLVRDPELIEEIIVKQFSCFRDVDFSVDEKSDVLAGNNPFVLKGDKWKKYRNYLTPCFTSPKLRAVFPGLITNAEKLVKFVSECEGVEFEPKRLYELFTAETVANLAFGIQANSFDHKKQAREFKNMASDSVNPDFYNSLKVICMTVMPIISKIFHVRFFSSHVQQRLIEIMKNTINYRRENGVIMNDFVDVFDSIVRKNNLDVLDACIFAASFFLDAFETSSSVMAFATYELCVNPSIQVKLRKEIEETFQKNPQGITYEVVTNDMPYLTAIIDETLRKYSPLPFLSRTCTKACTLEPIKLEIPVDQSVIVPVMGLHRDPKYFPEPDAFKPERFLPENSGNIKKFTFLPFGDGPRICIGRKFGILQVKVALTYMVKNFEFKLNGKTKLPLELDPLFFLNAIKGEFWANLHKI